MAKLPWPSSGTQWPPGNSENPTCHPFLCAQLQVALARVFGQGTLPVQAFPLRVGKETPQAAAANNQDVLLVVVPLLGDLQIRSAVLPRGAVRGLGGQ